jgi:hypothetical protein
MLERLRALWHHPETSEDVEPDTHVARTRETGGGGSDRGDGASTTGTGPSDEFVGRVAGQDSGSDEVSGAEVRAEAAAEQDEQRG